MTNNASSHKNLFIIIAVFIAMICGVSTPYAQVPAFNRLSPMTSLPTDMPHSIAIDQYENIYVSESVNNVVNIFTQSGIYINKIPNLKKPICVSVDNAGRIYVGNKLNGSVAVYDSGLTFLFNLGASSGEFGQPNDIAIDNASGNVYVVDIDNNVVRVYNPDNPPPGGDPSNSFIGSYDGTDNGGGQFISPKSVVVDSVAGEIIVLDTGRSTADGGRIQIFNMAFQYISGFDKYHAPAGALQFPNRLRMDSVGRLYVADSYFWNDGIHVYQKDGTYLGPIKGAAKLTNMVALDLGPSNILYIPIFTQHKVERYGIDQYTLMQISPLLIEFSGQRGTPLPPAQDVDISNNGNSSLNWTATANQGWITLSALSGTTAVSGTSTLSVSVDYSGMAAGSYYGTIDIISDTGSVEVVDVSLTLTDVLLIANPGGTYNGIEGQAIILDASNSSGAIDTYEWDIDSNGTYDYSSTLATQSHTYASAGQYSITLRVTDDFGITDVSSSVYAHISDAAPTTVFTGSSITGASPLMVNFTNSSTGYDQPMTYQWDFDSDGSVDSIEINPSHVYNSDGIYSVTLTTTDSDGTPDTLTRTDYITVSLGCQNPPVKITSTVPPPNPADSYFQTIQEAYNVVEDGQLVMVREMILSEVIGINQSKTVTIAGGYNCDFTSVTGKTTVNGDITISVGSSTIGNFVLN